MNFFKVRDQVHMGAQVGVPSNLRATQRAVKPKGRPLGSRGKSGSFWNPKERESLLLGWIAEHPREVAVGEQLKVVARFANGSSVYRTLDRLVAAGKIRKIKMYGKGSGYELVTTSSLPKGDQRNGEVIVRKSVPAITGTPGTPEPARLPTKTPARSSEEVFCENLDLFMWEYLKQLDVSSAQYQNTSLGEATQALRGFSKFMSDKQDTPNEKTDES